jgi:7-cyano-7-deazaguanine synthase
MDSIALAYWKRPAHAITVDYGQVSAHGELRAAAKVATELGMPHHVIRVDCSALGSGDLAARTPSSLAPERDWWPFRNQLLVTLAAMYVVELGIDRLLVGSVASDCGHRDGTAEFYAALGKLLAVQEGAIRVEAPALAMETADLIRVSNIPASLLGWAHSCHTGEFACGECRGCHKHMNVTEILRGHAY